MSEWIYQGKKVSEIEIPKDAIGFTYHIKCPDGIEYIGRKLFTSTSHKKPKEGTTRRKKIVKESNWKDYYSSSELIKDKVLTFGKEGFKREIIRFCTTRSELQYYEIKEIFDTDALLKDNFANKWLSAQINGRNLKYLMEKDNEIGVTKIK